MSKVTGKQTDEEIISDLRSQVFKLEKELKESEANCNRIIAASEKLKQGGEMKDLAKLLTEVVEDFLPNIGRCALQDFGRLNDAMLKARKAGLTST